MLWFRRLPARIRNLFSKKQLEQELDEELRFHLEMEIEKNLGAGMDAREARRVALLSIGGIEQTKEQVRDVDGILLVESTVRDVRYGIRTLRRFPVFTLVAVITLALGIGATTAIFSVVDSVLLKPLAVPDPERIVQIRDDYNDGYGLGGTTEPTYRDYRDRTLVFQHFAGLFPSPGYYIETTSGLKPISCHVVTSGLLPMLGVEPHLGRGFTPEDANFVTESPNDIEVAPVVMLSHGFWLRHFGGDPDVLGQSMRLKDWLRPGNDQTFTVVGVLPPGFRLPPLQLRPTQFGAPPEPDILTVRQWTDTDRGPMGIGGHVLARLKDGVTVEQAQANLDSIAAGIAAEFPETNAGYTAKLVPLQQLVRQNYGTVFYLLWAASGLVLLIASVNVANLLLARGAMRDRELTVRSALGAGRGRLFRQLLAESAVLGSLGGLAGLPLAFWGTRALVALVPDDVYRLENAGMDARVLEFLLGASMLLALLFGVLPAMKGSGLDLSAALNTGARGSRERGLGLLRLLVVSEVALALVLVTGGGLLVRTYRNLTSVELGFDAENVLTFRVDTYSRGISKYIDAHDLLGNELGERIRALPGVTALSMGTFPLRGGGVSMIAFTLADRPAPPPDRAVMMELLNAEPGYFETLGIALLAGRGFTQNDVELVREARAFRRQGGHVGKRIFPVIVNETMARRYWSDVNAAVGKVLYSGMRDPVSAQQGDVDTFDRVIVGVVADVKTNGLDEDPRPQIYFTDAAGDLSFIIRTSSDPLALTAAIRHELSAVDPVELSVAEFVTMEQRVATASARQRFQMLMLGSAAAMALLLAAAGLFGVMAYAVSQRTREIGIRMSLGARVEDIFTLVGGQSLRLVAVGLVIGLGGAFALTRFLSSMLFGVTPLDPVSFLGSALVLGVVAAVACYLPTRRATRVDPVDVLKAE